MKVAANFNVDVDVLKRFLDVLKENNEFPDDVIEKFMRNYSIVIGDDTDDDDTVDPKGEELTEELLERCKNYAVGQFARIVLRKLLEAGVASEDEIVEMQKAAGAMQIKHFHTDFGIYNKENFKTSFPVLITEQQKRDYDTAPAKTLVMPLTVRGEKFHLSAQWFKQNREPLENWVLKHLPAWFDNATEEEKSDMEKFIKSR